MEDRFSRVEARLEALTATVSALESRLARLEGEDASAAPGAAATAGPTAVAPAPSIADAAPPALVPLFGRSLMVLGGAFLLRAFADRGLVPQTAGALAGLLYAAGWLWAANRAAAAGSRRSALFHTVATAVIAFPLLWETTHRFGILHPTVAGAVLAAFTASIFTIAWRRELAAVAWLGWAGCTATAAALLVGGHGPLVMGVLIAVLPAAVFPLSRGVGSWLLPWLTAGVTNLVALVLAVAALRPTDPFAPGTAISIQWALLAAALFIAAYGALRSGVVLIETLHVVGAMGLGLVASVAVASRTDGPLALIGVGAGLLAALAYPLAFGPARRRSKSGYLLLTSLALALLLVAVFLLVPQPAWALIALSMAGAWLGDRQQRVTLGLHGAVLAIAAHAASGLLALDLYTLAAPASLAWPPIRPSAPFALAAAALCAWLSVRGDLRFWGQLAAAPKLILATLTALGIGAVLLALVAPTVVGVPGAGADPAALATLRTAMLALAAVALALASRADRVRETASLVHPVLGLAALKMLVQDFPVGSPGSLFLGLVVLGAAFIVAPRLRRPPAPATTAVTAPVPTEASASEPGGGPDPANGVVEPQ